MAKGVGVRGFRRDLSKPKGQSPISIVVEAVAKVASENWLKIRGAGTPAQDEAERSFCQIGYDYLSAREKAIYTLEREDHLARARARYEPPPSNDELYGRNRRPRAWLDEIEPFVEAALLALAAAAPLFGLIWVIQNLPLLIEDLVTALRNPQIVLLIAAFIAALILPRALMPLFPSFQYELVSGHEHWRHLQPSSLQEARSERSQILAMMVSGPDNASSLPIPQDPDLQVAGEEAVPIVPGVTELSLAKDRASLDNIERDLARNRDRHNLVFNGSFAAFLICLLFGLVLATVNGSFAVVGGIGVLATVIGTFCYTALRDTRTAQFALALFESYVVELRVSLDEAERAADPAERRMLRRDAWLEFRVGLNALYQLEKRGPVKARAPRRKKLPS